ncbi:MAG: hypothetical protein P9M14_07145 [Candidatus Alcyoniella australis]|nr:hypothetical protein [Candidatus Alcyoniella australis]
MSFLNYFKSIGFDARLAIAVYAKLIVICILCSYVLGLLWSLIKPRVDLKTAGRIGIGFWLAFEIGVSIQKASPLIGNIVFHMVMPYSVPVIGPLLGLVFLALCLWISRSLTRSGAVLGKRIRRVKLDQPPHKSGPSTKQSKKPAARGRKSKGART